MRRVECVKESKNDLDSACATGLILHVLMLTAIQPLDYTSPRVRKPHFICRFLSIHGTSCLDEIEFQSVRIQILAIHAKLLVIVITQDAR
jgi:hypothetical protein